MSQQSKPANTMEYPDSHFDLLNWKWLYSDWIFSYLFCMMIPVKMEICIIYITTHSFGEFHIMRSCDCFTKFEVE